METCVGCGSPLAPTWKFCVHCGLAVDEPKTTETIGAVPSRPVASSRGLLLGGIGIFLVGVALLIVSIAFFAGAFR